MAGTEALPNSLETNSIFLPGLSSLSNRLMIVCAIPPVSNSICFTLWKMKSC